MPYAQRSILQEVDVAARANARLEAQTVQRGIQFVDETLGQRRRDVGVVVNNVKYVALGDWRELETHA